MEYLAALPSAHDSYSACWIPMPAEKGADGETAYAWVPAQWLPELGRWSPWTAEQFLAGAEKFAETVYGTEATDETGMTAAEDSASGESARLFGTYRSRFMREGALAAIERMRGPQAAAPTMEESPEE